MKRLLCFILSAVLALTLCVPFSFAVAPLALAEAALAAYVASTGFKLWTDNGTGSDVVGLVTDLYDTYLQTHPEAMTLALLAQGNFITNDNSGNLVLGSTAVQSFQDFCAWIKNNYNVAVGGSEVEVIAPDVSVTFSSLQTSGNVTITNLASPSAMWEYLSSRLERPINYTSYSTAIDGFLSAHSSDLVQITVFRDSGRFQGNDAILIAALSGVTTYQAGSRISGAAVRRFAGNGAQGQPITITGYTDSIESHQFYVGYGNLSWASTIICNANATVNTDSSGLAVGLAEDMINHLSEFIDNSTGDVINTKSLVIDVGASPAVAGENGVPSNATQSEIQAATQTNIIDAVIDGYDSQTGVLPVVDTSVVSTEVIDTPVQSYPDVDSLGLPDLGLSLVTRFPFSIPWDISAIYHAVSAPSEPPVKTFDLIPPSVLSRWGISGSTSITIDLTDQKYSVLLAIIHWSCIISFCFGLAVMTKRYIWTTGG